MGEGEGGNRHKNVLQREDDGENVLSVKYYMNFRLMKTVAVVSHKVHFH